MVKKNLRNLVLFIVLSLVITACGSKTVEDKKQETNVNKKQTEQTTENKATETTKSDTFIFGVEADPGSSVNVITASNRMENTFVKIVYSPLFTYNSADDIAYDLAESITQSEDFLSYDVALRKNVKWHDGTDFTADDVIFTFETILKEDASGSRKARLIMNDQEVKMEKIDDYTVRFTFPSVNMAGIEAVSDNYILAKHIYEGEENILNSPKNITPVGTGPYKLTEYKAGEYMRFEADENYHLGAPKIKNLILKVTTDPNTALLALQSGELNALAPVTPADSETLAENITAYPYTENRIGYMAFNLGSDMVKDKEVREAILYAINKDDMLIGGYTSTEYAENAPSIIPKNSLYYTENVPSYNFDLEKAKELAVKSGADKLKLRVVYITGNKVYETQTAILQENLKQAGISLELIPMDSTAFIDKTKKLNSDYEIFFSGYIMGIDPSNYVTLFKTGSTNNNMQYSNPEVDKLFDEGIVETDNTKRKEIYEKIQQLIIGDAVFYPLQENRRIVAIDSNIGGIEDAKLVPIYTFGDFSKLYYK